MDDIIRLEHLSKRFAGGVVAVDDLTLGVREGEFVTLLGPSGCGKTTTLRMIAGFDTPTAGRVLLAGRDVTEDPPYARHAVNTVFQDYALFPHLSVRDNVGYGLRVTGTPRSEIGARVDEALRTVGLLDKADERPDRLSGGQRQRAALSRALVRKPKVLLLDEPLSALDAKLRAAMQVELKHLHTQLGITFVFVTHDQSEALVMSDRIVVMRAGRIAQSGSPAELYDQPASPYVANFIGVSNMIRGEVGAVNGDHVSVRFRGNEVRCRREGRRFAPGERALLSIRPEKVSLIEAGAATSEGWSLIEGRVIDCLFHGDSYRVEIDIAADEPFLIDVQLRLGAHRTVMPAPGASVRIGVDPDTVTAFNADESG